MTTIEREICISGTCLMDGKEATVRLIPSTKKGIYFYPDNSETGIEACLNNVISTQNCTILGKQDKQVRVVEHFMAACAFAGIDSLNVYINSSELPILDGSAKDWINAFNKAGIEDNQSQSILVDKPVCYSHEAISIALIPSENFKISYLVNFKHPDLGNRWISWEINDNKDEIIEGRTFGYLKDLERFQKMGLALGAKIDNIIGLTEDGYTIELKSQYEPIKHKILDLIGDLRLTGINPLCLKAHIIAQNAGHTSHVEFAKILQSSLL